MRRILKREKQYEAYEDAGNIPLARECIAGKINRAISVLVGLWLLFSNASPFDMVLPLPRASTAA